MRSFYRLSISSPPYRRVRYPKVLRNKKVRLSINGRKREIITNISASWKSRFYSKFRRESCHDLNKLIANKSQSDKQIDHISKISAKTKTYLDFTSALKSILSTDFSRNSRLGYKVRNSGIIFLTQKEETTGLD